MHWRTRKAVIQDRRHGYKLWKIAKSRRLSVNDVAEILVDAGLVSLRVIQLVVERESCDQSAGNAPS